MAKRKGKYLKPSPKRTVPWSVVVILSVFLLAAASVAVLRAYYLRDAGNVIGSLQNAQVSCEILETVDAADNTKEEVKVKNTSTVDVYIRVRLVSYWKTPSGKITARNSSTLQLTLGENWIAGEENTYYYKYPVKSMQDTSNLLGSEIQLLVDTEGYIPVIEVLAEAIQAEGKTASGIPAVTDAWGVQLVDGNITAVNASTP